ncbi:MAG: lysylphosphatidylglycerol synthase transmembrane domain-containing protein [Nitrososphaerales archaeon]
MVPNEDSLPAAAPGKPARRRSKVLLQRGLEIGVSLLFLWLAVRQIDFRALLLALRDADWIYILPAIAGITAMLLIKSWRWQIMFLPEHKVPFEAVLTAESAGYLASNVLPGRAGEAIRLVLLASDQPVGAARVLSTMVIERLLDTLSLLAVLAMLLPFLTGLPAWMMDSVKVLTIGAIAGTAIILVLSFWKERVLGWAHAVFRHVRFLDRPPVYTAIEHLIDGFAALRGRRGPALILLSFAVWAVLIVEVWGVRMAIAPEVSMTAMVFALLVTSLGMIVPSTPGYIGVFHGLVVLVLAPFGVATTTAMSLALVWHAVNYIVLSSAGLIMLAVHGTSLGQVVEKWRARGPAATAVAAAEEE